MTINTAVVRLFSLLFALALVTGCASTGGDGRSAGAEDRDADREGLVWEDGHGMEGSRALEESEAAALQYVFYFDFDRAQLSAEVRGELDRHVRQLSSNDRKVRLEGHADERGTREYNMALGERRAKAVADYLILQGISRSRVETVSYGEERPVAFSHDEEAWARNRRVELKLQ